MLQADKQVLLARTKQSALELRQRELEFHVERYTNLATQASIVAGFSFESMIELEIPEGTNEWVLAFYFVFGASAMALALYVVCIASFACVFGHRLALQGPHGSLEKAVHILIDHRIHIFFTAGVSLAFLVLTAVLLAWIKMGWAAGAVSFVFITFAYAVFNRMYLMFEVFQIPDDELVTGATSVQNPNSSGAVIDLSRLNPASRSRPHGTSLASQPSGAPPYARLTDGEASSLSPAAAEVSRVQHEGHLFKRDPGGYLSSETNKRRYFVLRNHKLFYFKSWEDFGAAGVRAAINAADPIDVRQHETFVVHEEAGKAAFNRFDLINTTDPLGRRWQLQAASANEASDWLMAIDTARAVERAPHAGEPNIISTCP